MRHKYETGTDLFGEHYVAFRLTFQNQDYGCSAKFRDECDRRRVLRSLAKTKQILLGNIAIVSGSIKSKQILSSYKL